MFDFDEVVNRTGTNCAKWDTIESQNKPRDVLPMWVADMDFRSPKEIQQALEKRIRQGVYGYSIISDEYLQAVIGWMKRRHDFDVEKEYKLKSKMRYSELEEWRKKAGLTRKEVADKCCVSPKTIEGWRLRGELPGYASALISRIMSDSIELQLSLPDFRKLMRHMERLNIKTIDEYIIQAVREKLSRDDKSL